MRRRNPLLEEALTYSLIGSFFDVRRELGYGYREHIYALALARLLISRGHKVAREVPVIVYFQGEPLARQVIDMIVDDKVIVENKSAFGRVREACGQTYSYLWGTTLEVGLVLSYGREPKFYRMICENRLKKYRDAPRLSDIMAPASSDLR
jgi:GxxExxY protein